MAKATDAMAALSDPTRRAIFERLSRRPMAVGEIAEGLPVTRPAVSQHLKVLRAARLVVHEAQGTRRVYRVDPAGLGALRQWLDRHWMRALAAFQEHIESEEKP